MNDIIADIVSQGVDMLISAIILSSICTMLMTSQNLNIKINEQQAIQQELIEYRKHNQFDNTEVYAQDIISAIMKYRGSPTVAVSFPSGDTYTWSLTFNSTPYSTTAISAIITSDYAYTANLVYDASHSVVTGYEFVAHN